MIQGDYHENKDAKEHFCDTFGGVYDDPCFFREGRGKGRGELAQRTTLAGAVIETYASRGQTANLTVWISDDGKRWREIAKADRVLGRYRFDFKGKNANRVKYVRVGREPGHGVDSFGLHKVWLYGKK